MITRLYFGDVDHTISTQKAKNVEDLKVNNPSLLIYYFVQEFCSEYLWKYFSQQQRDFKSNLRDTLNIHLRENENDFWNLLMKKLDKAPDEIHDYILNFVEHRRFQIKREKEKSGEKKGVIFKKLLVLTQALKENTTKSSLDYIEDFLQTSVEIQALLHRERNREPNNQFANILFQLKHSRPDKAYLNHLIEAGSYLNQDLKSFHESDQEGLRKTFLKKVVDDFSEVITVYSDTNKLLKLKETPLYHQTLLDYFGSFIMSQFNPRVINQLIKCRMKKFSSKEFFPAWLLDNKIRFAKNLQVRYDERVSVLTQNIEYPGALFNMTTTFYTTGTQSDRCYISSSSNHELGSYNEFHKELSTCKTEYDITKIMHNIIHQGKINNSSLIPPNDQALLYNLHGLLFYLEPMRNISAYLHNIVYFELLNSHSIKPISSMEDILPMAMKGAQKAWKNIEGDSVFKYSFQGDIFRFLDEDKALNKILSLQYLYREMNLLLQFLSKTKDIKIDYKDRHLELLSDLADFHQYLNSKQPTRRRFALSFKHDKETKELFEFYKTNPKEVLEKLEKQAMDGFEEPFNIIYENRNQLIGLMKKWYY